MIMEPYEVYRYYLALRLHFTTDKYDVIKQQGKVRASKQAFMKRTDLLSIKRVAETYSDKEVVDFLVSNFISGDRWGGIFDSEARDRYLDWKQRIDSLSYTFEKDIRLVYNHCIDNNITFNECFTCKNSYHPAIMKLFLRKDISIETLVILNRLNNFTGQLDTSLSLDLIWPDVSRIIKKYTPFLPIKVEKYDGILRRVIGRDQE